MPARHSNSAARPLRGSSQGYQLAKFTRQQRALSLSRAQTPGRVTLNYTHTLPSTSVTRNSRVEAQPHISPLCCSAPFIPLCRSPSLTPHSRPSLSAYRRRVESSPESVELDRKEARAIEGALISGGDGAKGESPSERICGLGGNRGATRCCPLPNCLGTGAVKIDNPHRKEA